MKNNLGRFYIYFLLLLSLNAFASDYEWSVQSSKNEVFVNQAIHLKYTCSFSDRAELYSINFSPLSKKGLYTIELLQKSEEFIDGKKRNSFEYIVFAKKSGELQLDFDVTMKKTTQEFINIATEGRDDDRGDDNFSQRIIRQKSVVLHVKENSVQNVGNFTFALTKDETNIKAFEPYHLTLAISGNGIFENFKALSVEIVGVKVFTQSPRIKTQLTKDGYKGVWTQQLVFVSENNFTIPSLHVEYFDLQSESKKVFKTDAIKLHVQKVFKKEELLDKEEIVEPFDFWFVYYIFTFIAGFLLAKIQFKKREKKLSKNAVLIKKISTCRDMDEIIFLLLLDDRTRYKDIINKIENKELLTVQSVKKELLVT